MNVARHPELGMEPQMLRMFEDIQNAEIVMRGLRAGIGHRLIAGDEMDDPTPEQIRAFDIRAAWRRGYVEGFQVAMLAMHEHCPPERWQELAAWVQDQLIRWRFSRIDMDSRPPMAPGPTSEPTVDSAP